MSDAALGNVMLFRFVPAVVVAYKTVFLLIPNTIGALTAPIGGLLATLYSANFVFLLAIAVSLISLGFFILVSFAKVPEEAET
jgi:hypothetical protein